VRQSTANDPVRTEAYYCEKMLRRECLEKLEEEIGSAIRRRTADRGEARRVFVMWRVLSCGSGEHRWRTKLHLDSRESLDDYHRSSTLGAAPKIVRALDA
jgi:hypothetical protein